LRRESAAGRAERIIAEALQRREPTSGRPAGDDGWDRRRPMGRRKSAPESQVRQGVTFGATVGRSRVLAGRHLGYLCVRRERRLA